MADPDRQQLVCFFYLLTRGTPDSPGMSWGDVKGLVRQVGAPPRVNSYASPAGEAMANELLDELITGARPSGHTDAMSDADALAGVRRVVEAFRRYGKTMAKERREGIFQVCDDLDEFIHSSALPDPSSSSTSAEGL